MVSTRQSARTVGKPLRGPSRGLVGSQWRELHAWSFCKNLRLAADGECQVNIGGCSIFGGWIICRKGHYLLSTVIDLRPGDLTGLARICTGVLLSATGNCLVSLVSSGRLIPSSGSHRCLFTYYLVHLPVFAPSCRAQTSTHPNFPAIESQFALYPSLRPCVYCFTNHGYLKRRPFIQLGKPSRLGAEQKYHHPALRRKYFTKSHGDHGESRLQSNVRP